MLPSSGEILFSKSFAFTRTSSTIFFDSWMLKKAGLGVGRKERFYACWMSGFWIREIESTIVLPTRHPGYLFLLVREQINISMVSWGNELFWGICHMVGGISKFLDQTYIFQINFHIIILCFFKRSGNRCPGQMQNHQPLATWLSVSMKGLQANNKGNSGVVSKKEARNKHTSFSCPKKCYFHF